MSYLGTQRPTVKSPTYGHGKDYLKLIEDCLEYRIPAYETAIATFALRRIHYETLPNDAVLEGRLKDPVQIEWEKAYDELFWACEDIDPDFDTDPLSEFSISEADFRVKIEKLQLRMSTLVSRS